jgi:8-oxo-dGTP pyrophosphatase MutT (NUDIX family)
MTKYVVGFMVHEEQIALIRKNRPKWQEGRLNGIGGHIEENEEPYSAMVREFEEETGYKEIFWQHLATYVFPPSGDFGEEIVYYFVARPLNQPDLKDITDELIDWYPYEWVMRDHCAPPTQFLLRLIYGRDETSLRKQEYRK